MTPTAELDQPAHSEIKSRESLTVADAVWVGTALLQRQAGDERSFSTEEIAAFVESLHLTKGARKSIWQHVNQHCVANRKPQPNRARMLFATGGGDRRLFRKGDRFDPEREGGRMHPAWQDLPEPYADLHRWYEMEWNASPNLPAEDPFLALIGTGKGLWDGLSPDEYVDSLRRGWEEPS